MVQPHFNMNSCRPDSLKLHFPHVKDLVQKALHLSFVIPEEGSFVECINPMPPGICTVNSSFFSAQNGVASFQNLPIQNLIYLYLSIYIYINDLGFHSFNSSNSITQTSLSIPSMHKSESHQDAIGRGYQCRASACGAMSAGKPWCSWSRPCLAITCAATGAGQLVERWNAHCVHFLSFPYSFYLCGNLKWHYHDLPCLESRTTKVCLNKFLQHKMAVHKYFDYSNF